MDTRSSSLAGRLAVVAGLGFLSCSLFVAVRYWLTGRFAQGYLLWNLLLAAAPVVIAWAGLRLSYGGRRSRAAALGAFVAWLIFYPNAPYIFTDFIHVVRRAGLGSVAAPWLSECDLLWYDIVMNAAFAFVGHYLGLVSMYLMHGAARRLFGRAAGWAAMAPAILLSGLGIHLGRFSRFNSWDLLIHPVQAVRVIRESIADPAALLFSTAFSLFIALTYLVFYVVKRGDIGELDGWGLGPRGQARAARASIAAAGSFDMIESMPSAASRRSSTGSSTVQAWARTPCAASSAAFSGVRKVWRGFRYLAPRASQYAPAPSSQADSMKATSASGQSAAQMAADWWLKDEKIVRLSSPRRRIVATSRSSMPG